ncbi:hypothetical protein [Natronorubrum halophilum]|uniref:hypothetical protein n=1 Tax=Natronorubrum halophilum TaxID=1702106 RepID=UPI000EF723D0|nr:hypothetical protein [Natronorubrum halophilum]
MPRESSRAYSTDRSQEIEVACPRCDRPTSVAVSDTDAEFVVRPYAAAFGEYNTAHCSNGHKIWIYSC